ncbi:MAG: twin-arginine translocase TatA/TatE family subunit [Actinomycetota bacterium]|nr:twin-arginine translocase TatA/TatE family subunit [Actinomycetota bacterium]MDP4641616.1 twin-arginine translocase TatA/TatE family subunit [Ilumatobacteraceae bacterium]MDP4834780.1 twin-arginine translocase TatA/TatE family subunit [Ilumatobacteraceae bacterium]
MFNLSGTELVFIAMLGLIVLGPEKLPSAMRRAGKVYREIRNISSNVQREVNKVMEEPIREVRKLVDEPVAEFKKTVSDKPISAKPAVNKPGPDEPESPAKPDVPPPVGP